MKDKAGFFCRAQSIQKSTQTASQLLKMTMPFALLVQISERPVRLLRYCGSFMYILSPNVADIAIDAVTILKPFLKQQQ